MICKFSVENFKAFAGKAELDFFANGNIKRLEYNYVNAGGKNILKTAGFYGPNNTGKTCILLSLISLRSLMLNEPHDNFVNSFAGTGDITTFDVEYFINGRYYNYFVSYNCKTRKYEKEKLIKKEYNGTLTSSTQIFERSASRLTWAGITPELKKPNVAKLFSFSFPFMILFDDSDNAIINQAKADYKQFAESIVFLKMDAPMDISKTIGLMQNDPKATKFIKEFVKNFPFVNKTNPIKEDPIKDTTKDHTEDPKEADPKGP